jgi:ubiquinol-cytochrome c reductase cytochrome b subunit
VGWIVSFVVAGVEVSSSLLIRFYVLHVIFIPLLMVFFFYLHFATVRRVGLSPLPGDKRSEDRPLYPDHILQLLVLFLVVFGVILTLGTIFPAPFWLKADPFTSPAGARPPWYLMPAYSLLELLPHWLAGTLVLAGLLLLILLPFLERSPHRELKKRPVVAGLAAALGLLAIVLTYLGYRGV